MFPRVGNAVRNRLEGAVVAVGSRSVVRMWGDDAVVKVPNDGVPSSWIRHEAQFTSAVWAIGVPAHRLLGIEQHGDKLISIYERVGGPTLWSLINAEPSRAATYGALLGELHARVLTVVPPVSLPRQGDRLRCKLRRASASFDVPYSESMARVPDARPSIGVCHGDFHPGNVVMSPGGPMIVDWFDACRGDAAADIARSSLLLGAGVPNSKHLEHLPGHTPQILGDVHAAYLATVCGRLEIDTRLVDRWRRVEAVARLAEGVDPTELLELWNQG
jgi:hypothetical protein